MADILRTIYADKAAHRVEAEAAEPYAVVRERGLARRGDRRAFTRALRDARGPAIVAEIKRASPSLGLIARDFDPAAVAKIYNGAGADAISVLTEADHFLGDLAYLDVVRACSTLPILRKDFLATPYDVAQSAAYGADCVLLIVAGLDDDALHACFEEAERFDMDVLVEVHDAAELQRALQLGATLVGVNNRDLRTFETDIAVSEHLIPTLPPGVVGISESGMRDAEDVARIMAAGARGILVGETLMRAKDPAEAIGAFKHAKPSRVQP